MLVTNVLLFIFYVFSTVMCLNVVNIEDKNYWYEDGRTSLHEMLSRKDNKNVAKNVILFVGDGMGMSTITAARIYREQHKGFTGEEGYLSWDMFPHVGLIKTYNTDFQVPDSAGTATAIFTGVKTKYEVIGFDDKVRHGICDVADAKTSATSSLIDWAQKSGKDTGFVTTTRVTHATPAALYSHVQNRNWECETKIPETYQNCVKDIARQLVEDEPGRNIKVILGGGLNTLGGENPGKEEIDKGSCQRKDGRNLVNEWKKDKEQRGFNASFVRTTEQLMALQPSPDQYVLGVFSAGHVSYDAERNRGPEGQPSIVNMTVKAIQLLQQNPNGFFLMVEGGRIDHGHHKNWARLALMEAERMDAAVSAALKLTGTEDTLIIVTADHSHSFTINGYPKRGEDILGIHKDDEGFVRETLTYANGPSFKFHRRSDIINPDEDLFKDITKIDRSGLRYQQFSPNYKKDESHGGEDLPVYAIGPFSHLFNGVHEQSYIAHAISCAARMGPDAHVCVKYAHSSASRDHVSILLLFTSTFLFIRQSFL